MRSPCSGRSDLQASVLTVIGPSTKLVDIDTAIRLLLTSIEAFPTTDFVLFPDASQSYAASFTPPPQPRVSLEPTVNLFESPAAATAARQLAYVDKATSTGHEDTAERPKKRIKITRTKQVIEKKKKPRHHCKLGKCGRSFGRNSDLVRHHKDWHGLSDKIYQCEVDACLHRTRRNDKMKEHCQKMHGHLKGSESFATVSGRNEGPGEAEKA